MVGRWKGWRGAGRRVSRRRAEGWPFSSEELGDGVASRSEGTHPTARSRRLLPQALDFLEAGLKLRNCPSSDPSSQFRRLTELANGGAGKAAGAAPNQ